MADATLLLRLFDGAREGFNDGSLVTLVDGAQRTVHRAEHSSSQIRFTIPVTDGPVDTYRVTVAAKDRVGAGQTGVNLKAGIESVVDVMLLPRKGQFRFSPLANLARIHPNLEPLVSAFLTKNSTTYEALQQSNPGGLATLFSICSAFSGFGAGGSFVSPDGAGAHHPLEFIEELQELKPDRFFAKASDRMVEWLGGGTRTFTLAPHALHPNSFTSYKEVRYPEGNVQFTFSKTDDGSLVVDSDIDLFGDTESHLLLEILPTDVLHANQGTDPRQAYAFRWMSVQRIKAATKLDFDPPFSVVFG